MRDMRILLGSGIILLLALVSPSSAQMTVTATAGEKQVSLLWSNVTGYTSYQVQNSTTSGGPYTVLSASQTTNVYLHSGLSWGVTNYYVITASTPTGSVVSAQVRQPAVYACAGAGHQLRRGGGGRLFGGHELCGRLGCQHDVEYQYDCGCVTGAGSRLPVRSYG